jgi:dihydroorotase
LDNRIDVIATDHAPHTKEEKANTYLNAPSGGPLVQHALPAMMQKVHDGVMNIETLVQKMCHNPAILFRVEDRGFLREGYHADLVLVDPNRPWSVNKGNLLYKCGWSPFEGSLFKSRVTHTFVGGHLVYKDGQIDPLVKGSRLKFNR